MKIRLELHIFFFSVILFDSVRFIRSLIRSFGCCAVNLDNKKVDCNMSQNACDKMQMGEIRRQPSTTSVRLQFRFSASVRWKMQNQKKRKEKKKLCDGSVVWIIFRAEKSRNQLVARRMDRLCMRSKYAIICWYCWHATKENKRPIFNWRRHSVADEKRKTVKMKRKVPSTGFFLIEFHSTHFSAIFFSLICSFLFLVSNVVNNALIFVFISPHFLLDRISFLFLFA